jgi:hypothetical protein
MHMIMIAALVVVMIITGGEALPFFNRVNLNLKLCQFFDTYILAQQARPNVLHPLLDFHSIIAHDLISRQDYERELRQLARGFPEPVRREGRVL